MKHQQAVYLQEMGITRWQVRKPELFSSFQGAAGSDLSRFSLLVLCSAAEFSHPLMLQILKAFKFPPERVSHCSIAEFENLQGPLPEYIWSTLGPINQPFGHKLLTSPSLSQLANNAKDKRALWEQFCAINQ